MRCSRDQGLIVLLTKRWKSSRLFNSGVDIEDLLR
jgi:hypothetical protein